MRSRTLAAICLMAPVSLTVPAAAPAASSEQRPLPEVVVTASLREGAAMQIPASLTIISEDAITAREARHLEEVLAAAPNVNFAAGTNRARYFQIRGMGERSQFVDPYFPSVGLLIDNVDFSGLGAAATLMDVRQVEVLRGPQGTRYGANALAGLINISTHEPSEDFSLRAQASLAQHGTQSLGLAVGGALNARVNARLAVERHESDGYIKNIHLGREDTNGRQEVTARARLAIEMHEDWDLGLILGKVDARNGYDAFSLDNSRRTRSDQPGEDSQDSSYAALKSVRRHPGFRTEIYLNAAQSDVVYGYDEDWAYAGFHPDGYDSTDAYLRQRDSASAEMRFVSEEAGRVLNGSTDLLAGIYLLHSDEALARSYTYLPDGFRSHFGARSLALFFQMDTRLGAAWSAHLGARSERKETEYKDSASARFAQGQSLWGGRLALEWQPLASARLYAAIARGYKAGGYNSDASLPAPQRRYGDEQLLEYELGLKGRFAGGRLEVQAALFHDERRDQQARLHQALLRADGSTEFTEFFSNAAAGVNQGLEVSINWAATANLRLHASLGLLNAEFRDFVNDREPSEDTGECDLGRLAADAAGRPLCRQDQGGRDQAHAPRHSYSLGLAYESLAWQASLSADGKGAFYFSDSHDVKSDASVLLNARVSYTSGAYTLSLWGRNLADEDSQLRGFRFGNDPRKGYATEAYYQLGEPRIIGVSLAYEVGN